MAGSDEVLFHNHQGEGFRYRYPLVQYKRIGGEAAVLFIQEGIDKVGKLFGERSATIRLGDREVTCELAHADARMTNVQIWSDNLQYTLRKYLPLNQHNFPLYQQAESLVERCQMLEKILVANILSFAKSMDIHFDEPVMVHITELSEPRLYRFKQVKLLGFDLSFTCNVSLPDFIGLGKGASLGFGVVKRMNQRTTPNRTPQA